MTRTWKKKEKEMTLHAYEVNGYGVWGKDISDLSGVCLLQIPSFVSSPFAVAHADYAASAA